MTDNFRQLTLRQAIAVQIFYSSPDDENLRGKTLTGKSWVENTGIITAITFREINKPKDKTLEKLIVSRSYEEILKRYDKPGAAFEMIVIYSDDKDEFKEIGLSNAIKLALSPEELPKQIMDFLLEQNEYTFLKN